MTDTDEGWHRAAQLAEIEPDEALPVDIGDIEIALCKLGDSVYALSNICTHEYACMSDGFIEGDTIECPLHQAQFDIPTGKAMSPPAELDLQTYPVKIVDGTVFVQIKS